jgi:glycogen phosphorylase
MTEPIFAYEPREFEGLQDLVELALDLRWSWDHAADDLWRSLDPGLWDLTRNPWVILQTIAPEKIERLNADANFHARLESVAKEQRESRASPAWFQKAHAKESPTLVAYFSMEFMLGEALPIYSGGLGNVAGDQLKGASDLGAPIVGVGLLYQQGYFRQVIRADGSQEALYPYNDPGQLPITPARDAEGEWVRLQLQLPVGPIWLRAWQARVGRVKLYLLDSNDPANSPLARGLTSQLYGGGPELRLAQELVLGIGGWRMLRALGLDPDVCHLNEGHAALAVLERAADWMQASAQPFEVALAVTRAGNLFTTHTPVAAGFDRFAPDLMQQYLGGYAQDRLGLTPRELMALGRQNDQDESEPFNMAYLAIRGSGAVNGVSRLHGQVSRGIFAPLFPRWPRPEVPVGFVTNGIHVPTWDSSASDALWTKCCGQERWLGEMTTLEGDIRKVPDAELWEMRQASRHALVDYARARYTAQVAAAGAPADELAQAGQTLNHDALTLGFARRFATYKRPNLLLHDPERLVRILANPDRPVQLLIAGKAHPADIAGQDLIRSWVQFTRRPDVRAHAVFLSDYDMFLTEELVMGVDVWINNPRRPWEACGTSGMKVLANGGLNLSELDGWWAEAYTPDVGWALGDGREHGDDPAWDAAEADTLYTLLENEVVPQFYRRDAHGLPTEWLGRMRESMALLTTQFSANRAVRQYTEGYYLPAAVAYRARGANKGALGSEIVEWRRALADGWRTIGFGELRVETREGQHQFEVQVNLGGIDPAAVSVELYADLPDGGGFHQAMARGEKLLNDENGWVYSAQVPAARPASDFTPRIIPRREGVAIPLEANLILWREP